jgi:KUP system potassium uptake protein
MTGSIPIGEPRHRSAGSPRALIVGAVGVVFGDIGTSPLYTMKLAFGAEYGLRATDANVLGILSMVFWSLMLVVTIKYVNIIMRADNRGEGGIMALMALTQRCLPIASDAGYMVGILGVFGAALFFGDGVITPAMTVLSAVEGLEIAAPALHQYVVPITIVVLLGLFSLQRNGTEKVGKLFGPVMVVWFLVLGLLGLLQVLEAPRVLAAVNPLHAIEFAGHHGKAAFLVLGAVVLAVTGAEALYADMGHFGRIPIRTAWLVLVMPALVLNYFGQGALLLEHPSAVQNPFFRMAPDWALFPLIVLATLAAVIASQAVISGAFSVARQAMLLGYLPRLEVRHTSADAIGQVFVPYVNRVLLVVVVALVLVFQESENLAVAYGVSVTGTMLIDTLIMIVLARARWHIAPWILWPAAAVFLSIDGAFLAANLTKFFDGAWFPIGVGLFVFTIMRTWKRGRELIREGTRRGKLSMPGFILGIETTPPLRVPGTAVFMTATNDVVPDALLHNLKHNKVLHQRNLLVTVDTVSAPRAESDERISVTSLGSEFYRVSLRFGFMEDPDVPRAMPLLSQRGLEVDMRDATYFASRETVVATARKGMPLWRDKLFAFMLRNAVTATTFFKIPSNRLVELGTQVEI